MNIRRATPQDAGPIAGIWNTIIRDTLATFNSVEKAEAEVAALIATRSGPAGGTFVAEEADRVIGFATYAQFRGGAGYAHTMEHTVYIDPERRGFGAGRALLGAAEADARANGAHSIFAGVSSANPEGRAFHVALGYAEVAVLPEVGFKWGRWLDLHLMQKRL